MTDVLVCVKRVVDSSGEVVLTEDGQSVDGRYAGYTMSNHEECAVEIAVQTTAATGGGDRPHPRRGGGGRAAASRAGRRLHRRRPRRGRRGRVRPGRRRPRDRRGRARARGGRPAARPGAAGQRRRRQRRLPGRDPAGLRARPAGGQRRLAGLDRGRPRGGRRRAPTGTRPTGFRSGGRHGAGGRRRAALPDGARPDESEEGGDRESSAGSGAAGSKRVRLLLPPPQPSSVQILGKGADAAPAVVDLLEQLGGDPMILVLVETDASGADEVSRETITFARGLSAAGGGVPIDAVVIGELPGSAESSPSSWRRTASATCTTSPAKRSRRTAAPPGPVPCSRCARPPGPWW